MRPKTIVQLHNDDGSKEFLDIQGIEIAAYKPDLIQEKDLAYVCCTSGYKISSEVFYSNKI